MSTDVFCECDVRKCAYRTNIRTMKWGKETDDYEIFK